MILLNCNQWIQALKVFIIRDLIAHRIGGCPGEPGLRLCHQEVSWHACTGVLALQLLCNSTEEVRMLGHYHPSEVRSAPGAWPYLIWLIIAPDAVSRNCQMLPKNPQTSNRIRSFFLIFFPSECNLSVSATDSVAWITHLHLNLREFGYFTLHFEWKWRKSYFENLFKHQRAFQ